jgi:hypothetical protein
MDNENTAHFIDSDFCLYAWSDLGREARHRARKGLCIHSLRNHLDGTRVECLHCHRIETDKIFDEERYEILY